MTVTELWTDVRAMLWILRNEPNAVALSVHADHLRQRAHEIGTPLAQSIADVANLICLAAVVESAEAYDAVTESMQAVKQHMV